jgi:hypothetical protein
MRSPTLLLTFALCAVTASVFAADEPIDFNRARELHQRANRGEKLSAADQEFLNRARAEFAKRNGGGGGGRQGGNVPPPRAETGLVPLTDLTASYQGEDGGLYGGGKNEPPPAHAAAAQAALAQVQPLDANGKPSPDGKIVLITIGMSNTTQESQAFLRAAANVKGPHVVLVDGAQGGQTASVIANPEARYWSVSDERVKAAGVTPAQVQVAWLKEANAGPSGGFPSAARKLSDDLASDVRVAKARYPNLRVIYLSSRIYAGYATTGLNPEPYAYESAFAVRWPIQAQMKGDAGLNIDPKKGEVKAPVLLWGPYLWADGEKGRRAGDVVWKKEDLGPDGTHPSESGRKKVADLLVKFFKEDALGRGWFGK